MWQQQRRSCHPVILGRVCSCSCSGCSDCGPGQVWVTLSMKPSEIRSVGRRGPERGTTVEAHGVQQQPLYTLYRRVAGAGRQRGSIVRGGEETGQRPRTVTYWHYRVTISHHCHHHIPLILASHQALSPPYNYKAKYSITPMLLFRQLLA